MSNLNTKQINTKIKTFLVSDKKQRDKIQELLELAINHAKQHGDFSCLSLLIKGLQENKSRNLKAITAYVLDHVKSIHWVKEKAYIGYKKIKNQDLEFKELVTKWFDHKLNAQVIAVDPMARVKGLITSLTNALEQGNIKEGEQDKAREAIKALQPLVA